MTHTHIPDVPTGLNQMPQFAITFVAFCLREVRDTILSHHNEHTVGNTCQ